MAENEFLQMIHGEVVEMRKSAQTVALSVSQLKGMVETHIAEPSIHTPVPQFHEAGECSGLKKLAEKVRKHTEEHPRIVKDNLALWLGSGVFASCVGGIGLLKLLEYALSK